MENMRNFFSLYWFLANAKKNELQCKNKAELCCLIIEDALHFLGIIAASLYRESKIQTREIDHTLFMSFERSFFGSWLYIIRKIGETFYYQNYQTEVFTQWISFYKKYGSDQDIAKICSELLQFRNDYRHGGTIYSDYKVSSVWQDIQKLFDHLNFIDNYYVCVHKQGKMYYIGNNEETEQNTKNEAESVLLIHKKDKNEITIHPFVSYEESKQMLLFNNVSKEKITFYDAFGIKNRYETFLQERDGKYIANRSSLFWNTHRDFQKQIEETVLSFQKILLLSPPGGGKTFAMERLSSLAYICCSYHVDESPLKIKPFTALKTFVYYFEHTLGEQPKEIKSIDDAIATLKALANKFCDQKFIIAVDGLFSIFCQQFFENKWFDILNDHYPDNLVWVVSATKGLMIPSFHNIAIEIPPLSKAELEENFSDLDCERAMAYSQGIPMFLQQHIDDPESNLVNDLFWQKYCSLFIKEDWHKKVLLHFTKTTNYISIKEIASSLEIFTPKIEKFIHEIKVLLTKNDLGYMVAHPLCCDYIRRKLS